MPTEMAHDSDFFGRRFQVRLIERTWPVRQFAFAESKQFSAASVPPAFDSSILVVVVALLEMALCVAFTAGHDTNRQHSPTLALFEIWGQAASWRGC